MSHKNQFQDKSCAQRIHAKRRALERYGLTLNRIRYNEFVDMIKRHASVFIVDQSQRRSIHLLVVKEGRFLVAYDSLRGNITTFLPPILIEDVVKNLHNHKVLIEVLKGHNGENKLEESEKSEKDDLLSETAVL